MCVLAITALMRWCADAGRSACGPCSLISASLDASDVLELRLSGCHGCTCQVVTNAKYLHQMWQKSLGWAAIGGLMKYVSSSPYYTSGYERRTTQMLNSGSLPVGRLTGSKLTEGGCLGRSAVCRVENET